MGDVIELAMNVVSLQGFVKSVEWEKAAVQDTPHITQYSRDAQQFGLPASLSAVGNASVKVFCDLNRVCEIEDAVVEWYEEAFYQRRGCLLDLSFLKDNFTISELLYAGVDGTICKARLLAKAPGTLQRLGLPLQVKTPTDQLVNEVKRIGYLKDREAPL